jgi:hypothetical protein
MDLKIFGIFLLIKKKKIGFFNFFHEESPSGEEANKAEDRQYVSSLLKRKGAAPWSEPEEEAHLAKRGAYLKRQKSIGQQPFVNSLQSLKQR